MSKRRAEEICKSPDSDLTYWKKMDQKSTPDKELSYGSRVIQEVKSTAPEWFVKAFSFLVDEMNTLKQHHRASETANEDLKLEVGSLSQKVEELEEVKKLHSVEIEKLSEKLTSMELYSRRDNLIIGGILETPSEDIKTKILGFFKEELKIPNGGDIMLTRVHRLGKPLFKVPHFTKQARPVIVRFHYFPDRQAVWRACWSLKDKTFSVSEDFPNSVKDNRRTLLPCLRAAKRDPQVTRCSLTGDTLWINGTKYTVNNIDSLPQRYRWSVKGERYFKECDSTFFFGQDSFSSNHHSSPFTDEGITYSCSEQYYLRRKCLYFNDEAMAQNVMRNDNPGKMKGLSYRIKGLDEAKWRNVDKSVMEKACFLKFSKNKEMQTKLLASRGNIVEANKKDRYFSCGLSLADPTILDKSRWLGENTLGVILTNLRESLQMKN